MTAYDVALRVIAVGTLLALSVVCAVAAFRTPRSRPPDPAVWQERLAKAKEAHRHRAPAKRICVVERTEPNIRLAEVNAHIVNDRPGRHARQWIEQPTCVLPDFPRLIREGKL